ncbi:MAG: ribosome biogenesis GTPase [Candidatus Azotimanducaceae bacterium]
MTEANQTPLSLTQLSLTQLGWNNFFQQQVPIGDDSIPARVVRQDLGRYQLMSEQGLLVGILQGKARLESSKADLPTVGDWVLVKEQEQGDEYIIQSMLERATKFSRKQAGEKFYEQVVAANIDTVFIVTGLDDNFNAQRIERYVFLCNTSGALPVIILNKADVCDNRDRFLDAVREVASNTPVHVISALNEEGIQSLKPYISEGTTVAVLGSSGVGKSTLINSLLGYEHFKTGAVRDTDSRGRHTTTHRELCPIPGGGLIIDTPGMRELQIWSDEQYLATTFEDVDELATLCKFTNCHHQSEPGCAIQSAIKTEDLSLERWESYLKYLKELAFLAEQQDINAKLQKKANNKKFAKFVRNRSDKRDDE